MYGIGTANAMINVTDD